MKFNLRAANIIVIGGATGIGYSAAQKLLDAGAKSVILASRNESKLNTAKQAFSSDMLPILTDIGYICRFRCKNNNIGI